MSLYTLCRFTLDNHIFTHVCTKTINLLQNKKSNCVQGVIVAAVSATFVVIVVVVVVFATCVVIVVVAVSAYCVVVVIVAVSAT